MKVKILLSTIVLVAMVNSQADNVNEIDVNGNFEKCGRNVAGILSPISWLIHKSITTGDAEANAVYGRGKVKSGKFSFHIANSGGETVVYYWPKDPIAVKNPGKTIQLSAFLNGKGQFQVGFYLYNKDDKYLGVKTFVPENRKSILTLNTDEEWEKIELKAKIPEKAKDRVVTHLRFWIKVIDGDFIIDDLKLKRKE